MNITAGRLPRSPGGDGLGCVGDSAVERPIFGCRNHQYHAVDLRLCKIRLCNDLHLRPGALQEGDFAIGNSPVPTTNTGRSFKAAKGEIVHRQQLTNNHE